MRARQICPGVNGFIDEDWAALPKCPTNAASGTLATSRLGPGCDTLAYIWPRSWRKPETLTLPIRPGCAFDPKCDSRLPCVRSEPEALPGSPGDHLLLDEKIATSSTPSNRLAARLFSGRRPLCRCVSRPRPKYMKLNPL
jgi:hypothetical protein